jgi:DNA-binding Lrp family transcriptional regulator
MGTLTGTESASFGKIVSRYSEENYFYLVRNYLGTISTPFHKPALTARLCDFFSQEAIQERIVGLLDDLDLIILSLLRLSGPATAEQITSILKYKTSYGALLRRIANLQERMVLLNDGGSLCLNSLLASRLSACTSLELLLGTADGKVCNEPYVSTEFVRAYLSLVAQEQRTACKDEYLARFPAFPPEQLRPIFARLATLFSSYGLLVTGKGKQVTVDYRKAEALLSLDDRQLLCFLIAAEQPEKYRQQAVGFANMLIGILPKVGTCDTASLKLLVKALLSRNGLPYDSAILETLSCWGIVTFDELWHANAIEECPERSPLVIDSDYTVSYTGSCAPDDLLFRFADLRSLDRQTSYKVSSQSICRAFDQGLSHRQILRYLESDATEKMGRSLKKMLELTAQRYDQISVYDGIVLRTEGRTARLIEQLDSLQNHCVAKLADGIFLMQRTTEATWRQILASTGAIVPATVSDAEVEIVARQPNERFEQLLRLCHVEKASLEIPTGRPMRPTTDLGPLRQAIEDASLTDAQRKDLLQRFESRMVLTERQIVGQVVNGVIEAGGFDYQGKVSLCKQAAGKQNIALQLQLTDEELTVQALEVAFTPQREALLRAAVMPTMEVKIIPVSKIFKVKQLRYYLR